MKTPSITINRRWSAMSVRQTCIEHDLYTRGDNEEYKHMLQNVSRYPYPDIENLYRIAKDIQQHSKGKTVTNVMYLLEKDAVITTFEIDGLDDI